MTSKGSLSVSISLFCFFLPSQAKSQDLKWHYFSPIPVAGKCQSRWGPSAAADGSIGASFGQRFAFHLSKEEEDALARTNEIPATARKEKSALEAGLVVAGGPAEKAGIRNGSRIYGRDGTNAVPLDVCEFQEEVRASAGRSIELYVLPPSPEKPVAIPISIEVKRVDEVEPLTATESPENLISQEISPNSVYVSVELFENPETDWLRLKLSIMNLQKNALFDITELKAFVLDKDGHSLRQIPLSILQHQVQSWDAEVRAFLASGPEQIPMPVPQPPPPPQPPRYSLRMTADGSYNVTLLGQDTAYASSSAFISGELTPEPDTGQQFAYAVANIATLLNRIRIARANKKLKAEWDAFREEMLASIASSEKWQAAWEKEYFDPSRPVVPGENRDGTFLFQRDKNDLSTARVVLVLIDPSTQKQEFVTFEFRP